MIDSLVIDLMEASFLNSIFDPPIFTGNMLMAKAFLASRFSSVEVDWSSTGHMLELFVRCNH